MNKIQLPVMGETQSGGFDNDMAKTCGIKCLKINRSDMINDGKISLSDNVLVIQNSSEEKLKNNIYRKQIENGYVTLEDISKIQ